MMTFALMLATLAALILAPLGVIWVFVHTPLLSQSNWVLQLMALSCIGADLLILSLATKLGGMF